MKLMRGLGSGAVDLLPALGRMFGCVLKQRSRKSLTFGSSIKNNITSVARCSFYCFVDWWIECGHNARKLPHKVYLVAG